MRWFCALVLAAGMAAAEQSPLDRYIEEAERSAARHGAGNGGSLFFADGPLAELARDLRARQVNDLVTVLVVEQATALSRGSTSTSRESSARGGVSALYGAASGRWVNLANGGSSSSLDGEGATTRQSTVATRLSARVSHVLLNGYLVVEGHKEVVVNSERQLVTVRGVVRPADLRQDNTVTSDRLAQIEIRINGKGVVNDAIRRPFFLYRLLMGILPF